MAQLTPALDSHPLPDGVGVIDIGSNSVRLVLYSGLARNPLPAFNEKILCGLGRDIASSGYLNPDALDRAYSALRRFKAVIDAAGIGHVEAVATAAVRDARDGPDFVIRAEQILENKVRVLSGADEARYAALGVLAGIPDADGLVGDLGGGSLELVDVSGGAVGQGATLPIGPLRLMSGAKGSPAKSAPLVEDALAGLDWLDHKGRAFYAVGGVWRSIARIRMADTSHPLRVLHQYEIDRKEAHRLADLVAGLSQDTLRKMPMVSSRRIEAVPYGAVVLRALLDHSKVDKVVISAFGLREGLLFGALSEAVRKEDPLLVACAEMNQRQARFPLFGEMLFDWLTPLFPDETPREERLRRAACLLSDINWRFHPDYRGEQTLSEVLHTPFAGLDHAGRAFLGTSLYHRYEGASSQKLVPRLEALLSDAELTTARSLGLGLRLANSLAGATPSLLGACKLKRSDKKLELCVSPGREAVIGEIVEKRLNALCRVLDLAPEIRADATLHVV